jgi:hypothetical protein
VGSGGAQGTGGIISTSCTPGELDCDAHLRCGPSGNWQNYQCGPLFTSDVQHMNASGLSLFANSGFRCKSLTVCGVQQACIYYFGYLGSVQSGDPPSGEPRYNDGEVLDSPQALKIRVDGGAASQCTSAPVSFAEGDYIIVKLDGERTVQIDLPAFQGQSLTLYVREDGATFYDAGLTQPAG